MSERPPTPATGTQAVDRAARLVALVVDADEPLTTQFIADELGLPKSTTSRLISALETADLLERTEAGFVAGPLFWLYAARHDPWQELGRIALPVLERVGAATRETVHLGVARNGRVAHVAQVDSEYLLGTRDWTDIDVPAHASATGKVLMALDGLNVPDLPLAALTEHTLTDPEELRVELDAIATQGYAITVDELEMGLTAVAVPVIAKGQVFGAVGVSGPTSRLDGHHEEYTDLLVHHATELGAVLRRRTSKEGAA